MSFAVPAFGQQKDTANPRILQQHDLFGVPEALSEFGELHQKLDEPSMKVSSEPKRWQSPRMTLRTIPEC
jgi:hypothetical protein